MKTAVCHLNLHENGASDASEALISSRSKANRGNLAYKTILCEGEGDFTRTHPDPPSDQHLSNVALIRQTKQACCRLQRAGRSQPIYRVHRERTAVWQWHTTGRPARSSGESNTSYHDDRRRADHSSTNKDRALRHAARIYVLKFRPSEYNSIHSRS